MTEPGVTDRLCDARALRDVASFRAVTGQLLLLSSIGLAMMFVRLIFAPLLVEIQNDLAIGPARSARFFLFISIGYTAAMLVSGFVAKRLLHRGAIVLSGAVWTLGLVLIAISSALPLADIGFLVLGIGTGLYPPSGVASVSDLAASGIRARAIAANEVGPSAAFVLAPLFVNALLRFGTWRSAVLLAALVSATLTVLYAVRGRTGYFAGESPRVSNVTTILKTGRFWALLVFFLMAASSTMGVYSILPTFLVRTHGIELATVNAILGASRVSGVVLVLLAGHITERLGVKVTISIVLIVTGVLTVLVGTMSGTSLLVAVFLQPMVISVFFPAAIVAMAAMTAPELRNVIVSIMIPAVNLVAAGVFPSFMGALLEQGRVGSGLVATGVLMVVSVVLFPLLWGRDRA